LARRTAVVDEEAEKLDRLHSLAALAARLMQRAQRLAVKIDEAFAGEPFSRKWPAEHPNNVKRFQLYVALHLEAHNLELRACRLWLWAHDIRPEALSQLVATPTAGKAREAEAPPGYRVAAYAPGQILLQREEVTPEGIPVAPTVTNATGFPPRSHTEFAESKRKQDSEKSAKRKPH
jgi:hypothetical protein